MSLATIDATYGSGTANSYVTDLSEADSIADALHKLPLINFNMDAWLTADESAKTAALIYAAKGIDRHAFVGVRLNDWQRQEWPRTGTGKSYLNHGENGGVVPEELKWSQVVEAADILSGETSNRGDARNILSESVGDHSVTYDRASVNKLSEHIGNSALAILRRSGLLPSGTREVYMPRG